MKKKTTTQKAAVKASKKPLRDLTTLESRASRVKAGARYKRTRRG